MKNNFIFIFIGFIIGFISMGFITNIGEHGLRKIDQMKKECEKTLPKNQECKLIFIPKEQSNDL